MPTVSAIAAVFILPAFLFRISPFSYRAGRTATDKLLIARGTAYDGMMMVSMMMVSMMLVSMMTVSMMMMDEMIDESMKSGSKRLPKTHCNIKMNTHTRTLSPHTHSVVCTYGVCTLLVCVATEITKSPYTYVK